MGNKSKPKPKSGKNKPKKTHPPKPQSSASPPSNDPPSSSTSSHNLHQVLGFTQHPELLEDPQLHTFSFKVHPIKPFKKAIHALSDNNFNRHGVGFVEVGPEGFEITVDNREGDVGYLALKGSGLIEFMYRNYHPGKMSINLVKVDKFLSSAKDDVGGDTLLVYHFEGSLDMCFALGTGDCSNPDRKLTAYMSPTLSTLGPPNLNYFYKASIPSEEFRQFIQFLGLSDEKLVYLEITDVDVCALIGQRYVWDYIYDHVAKGMKLEQVYGVSFLYEVSFFWPKCETLKKALEVADEVSLCLVLNPLTCMVVFRFSLGELGDLIYMRGVKLHDTGSQPLDAEPFSQAAGPSAVSSVGEDLEEPSRWLPPDAGEYKINIAASVISNGKRGIGVIIRDSVGDFNGAACRLYEFESAEPDEVELRAARYGLFLAREISLKKVIIETDCINYWSHFEKRIDERSKLAEELLSFNSCFSNVGVSYVHPRDNKAARRLAELSLDLGEDRVWMYEVPEELKSIVAEDNYFLRPIGLLRIP